ncbi:MAG: nucleotidyltransferase family protein [bacterium]
MKACDMEYNVEWSRLIQILTGKVPGGGSWTEDESVRLVQLAQSLGVASLLHVRLAQQSGFSLPAAANEALRTAHLRSAMRNTRVYHYFGQILAELTRAEIPVVLLKGVGLARFVYPNIAARPMADIDILVAASHLERAVQAVRLLGYQLNHPRAPGQPVRHHVHLEHEQAPPLEINGSSEFIDSTLPVSDAALAAIWARTRPVVMNGLPARLLSPEDELPYLCLHAAITHRFVMDLRPFVDIAALVARYPEGIDWAACRRHAKEWGAPDIFQLPLVLAAAWAGAAVPAEFLAAVPPHIRDARLVEHVRRKVLRAPSENVWVDILPRTGTGSAEVEATVTTCASFNKHGLRIRSRDMRRNLSPPQLRAAARLAWRWMRGEVALRSSFRQERILNRLVRGA